MKIKLTPELSYIIGIWSRKKCPEGVGITAGSELLQIFAKEVLAQGLTPSDKLLSDGNKIYFYHSKYRKFFQQIEEGKLERYRYLNEYSASYLAGAFDAAGGISESGIIYLDRFGPSDDILLSRLGFPTKKVSGKLVIGRPRGFLIFIKNYTQVFPNHPIMGLLRGGKRLGRMDVPQDGGKGGQAATLETAAGTEKK